MLSDLTVRSYLDQLASGAPAPGGGAAAALIGAQGAALISMVCRLTLGRKKYADAEAVMALALESSERLRARLAELGDEDVAAYEQVMAAYSLPKDTPVQVDQRKAVIQAALKTATRTPLETLAACVEVMELCPEVLGKGNANAISDGGAGLLAVHASAGIAALNVRINLAQIEDAVFVSDTETTMAALLARGNRARNSAWDNLGARLDVHGLQP